jgi:hypothetical protein
MLACNIRLPRGLNPALFVARMNIIPRHQIVPGHDPAEQAQYPDRCVGPVRIGPILNAAFEAGIKGEEPVLNAARH